MKLKKILALSSLFALSFVITACGSGDNTSESSLSVAESSESTEASEDEASTSSSSVDLNALELPQLNPEAAENEDVVEMVTTKGTIKIKLFPEIAPKAVENFMTHAKDGYYDGVIFHRVIEDFMIQGGDPDGTGMGGESIWGDPFGMEISDQLYHIRGAFAMARTQEPVSQGSQFYIVQNDEDESADLSKDFYPDKIVEAYKKGGTPNLDGQYTVFGQVMEGMDVVDAIAALDTDGNDKPKEDVKIESIKIIQEAK